MAFEKSKTAFDRARQVIPGGVNSPARAFGAVGGHPVFIDRGDGPFLFDLEGNRFTDYIGSWGPHLLGHRHPQILAAISEATARGTSFGAPTEQETELAELIHEAMPSMERIRLVSSGTEATMSAIRVARGFTGRPKIIKFAGCYHGHVDALLVKAGSGALTHGTPSSPGIPQGCTADTIVAEFNDPAGLEEIFASHGEQIACAILEPIVGNMGVVAAEDEFLQTLRRLCSETGAVLIFDEVMTGFRVGFGGAQKLLGVTPDMTTLGKIIGGGLPVGAYGGRADVMATVSPEGSVYQAGTLSGNPMAVACGLAMLNTLRETNPYPLLESLASRLADGFLDATKAAGIPAVVSRVGSMLTLFFQQDSTSGPVRNFTDALASDTDRFAKFFWEMLHRGQYLPCSQFEAMFVSTAHSRNLIDETIAAAEASLAAIAT